MESTSWIIYSTVQKERGSYLANIFWFIRMFLKLAIRNDEFLTAYASLTEVCTTVHTELVLPNIISWIYQEEGKYNFPDLQTGRFQLYVTTE